MVTLDLTLASLRLAGVENFTPEFGTKEADNVGVGTENLCRDLMLPFTKQRPIEVNENSVTGVVQADSRLIMTNSGITLELGNATFAGCRVEIYAAFATGTAIITFAAGSGTQSVVIKPAERIILISNGNNLFGVAERIYNGEISNVSLSHTNLLTDKKRFIVYDFSDAAHKSIVIKKHTHIPLDVISGNARERRWFDTGDDDLSVDLAGMINAAAAATSTNIGVKAGRNFYIYLYAKADGGVGLTVSCNSTFPNDINPNYTANNTRKIGQFHTLCVAAGEALTATVPAASGTVTTAQTYLVKGYDESDEDGFYNFYNKQVKSVLAQSRYDVLTVEHPLAKFSAGDILPESIWCLTFRPHSNADGMVYDVNTDTAVDIYLQSGTGRNTKSVFAATTVRNRQPINHQDDFLQVKKRLPYDTEFLSFTLGSNERTAIKGAAESSVVTTGGHLDTANRRMISFIGCEDCCGAIWQWLAEFGPTGGSGFSTYDEHARFGQSYGVPYELGAGGDWNDSSSCGSRARDASDSRSNTNAYYGGRGVSRVMRHAQ